MIPIFHVHIEYKCTDGGLKIRLSSLVILCKFQNLSIYTQYANEKKINLNIFVVSQDRTTGESLIKYLSIINFRQY